MDKYITMAEKLQETLGMEAEKIAKSVKFIQRRRTFSTKEWLTNCLLWASTLMGTLATLSHIFGDTHIHITRQGLHKRFNQNCANFLLAMISLAIHKLVSNCTPDVPPLLNKFNGVYVGDCTTVALAESLAEQYPGCGGNKENVGLSAVKIFLRTEIKSGNATDLIIDTGKTSDHIFIRKASKLPSGSLELLDLGFCEFKRLEENAKSNIFYITRVQTNNTITYEGVTYTLPEFFAQQKRETFDINCELGNARLPVRLVAVPSSDAAAQRRMKRKRRKAEKSKSKTSEGQEILSHWIFYFTNIPESMCSLDDIISLYTVRWQIELVFKLWKSKGGLGRSNSTAVTTGKKTWRSLCEVLIKLLGLIICNWFMLERGGRLCGISAMERFQYVYDRLPKILYAIQKNKLSKIQYEIKQLIRRLDELSPPKKSKNKILTRDLLLNTHLYYKKYVESLS